MPFRQIDIPALDRKLSNIMASPSSADLTNELALDEYFRLGGNCVHCHGEGGETQSRRATGEWLNRKRVRKEFFVCTQICHDGWDETNHRAIGRFTPEAVREDIANDLELLATDYLDLVYLDDHPETPLESVVEALGRELKSGRVRALGVRNWTAESIIAANSQLHRQWLPGIGAIITTELALASATEPLWPGYLPFGPEIARLVRASRAAVFAHAADVNLGQCLYKDADATSRMRRHWVERWDHSENLALVRRAQDFARAHGLTPREVNVAWLLNRPFPCIGIVPLPSLLTSYRSEYENASQLLLEGKDQNLLSARSVDAYISDI